MTLRQKVSRLIIRVNLREMLRELKRREERAK